MDNIKIVLPKIEINDRLYDIIKKAFGEKINPNNVFIAKDEGSYTDNYYFNELDEAPIESPEVLENYLDCYDDVCMKLAEIDPENAELYLYLRISFYVYAIRAIHRNVRKDEFITLFPQLEKTIDENRFAFENNKYASKYETRCANRYVNIGANFNLSFLLPITLRCNKRCRQCMTFSPYADLHGTAYHPTFDYLCRQIDKMFEIIDNSYGIQFGGGETLMRKDLPELIDYVGNYKERISDFTRQGTGFGIITNSSIDFSDELIAASKRFGPKLCWLLDDYHFSKGKEIAAKLEANGINYDYRDQKTEGKIHCGGWVNLTNDFSKPTDPILAKKFADRCGQKQLIFQFVIADGKMFPCSRPMSSYFYWKQTEISKQSFVDMFDENTSKEQKCDKIRELLCNNYFYTCDKCKGLHNMRKRYYPAEQLTNEEMRDLKSGKISMLDFGNYDE